MHSLIVYIPQGSVDGLFLERLEEELADAVWASGSGAHDGHGQGREYFEIFLDGPDAEAMFDAVAPVIEKHPLPKGSHAIKRFGAAPDARTERVDLEWAG